MGFQPQQVVLVDANVVLETRQTGCQNRDPEHWIDESVLRGRLTHVEPITEVQRVTFNMAHDHPILDAGGRDLLIYAETLAAPAWLLNGPDMAAVCFAHSRGWIDRLASFGVMSAQLKTRLGRDLRDNYTDRWLSYR